MFTDQLGRKIIIEHAPERIISLVPSQTELLYDLGLREEVVGITKFCVHPAVWFQLKKKVGGTKKLHLDIIRQLHPDLIIANKEENTKEQLEELMEEFPVWISDVSNLRDALGMITSVGEITGKNEQAEKIADNILTKFKQLQTLPNIRDTRPDTPHPIPQTPNPELKMQNSKCKCAYLIWRSPWMVAGKGTFINEMMQYCGLENCFGYLSRYPEIKLEQLNDSGCKHILLSSEPFPFKEKHAEEIRKVVPGAEIIFVDGEMFSWYGSRLLKAPEYFKRVRKNIID